MLETKSLAWIKTGEQTFSSFPSTFLSCTLLLVVFRRKNTDNKENSIASQKINLCELNRKIVPDLHLAAELGKTLLDRNRELETHLKEKQGTIEDQKLEIEVTNRETLAHMCPNS